MSDRREIVLQALFAALATLPDIALLERNRTAEVPAGRRPALVLYDGDEEVGEAPRAPARTLVTMTPEVVAVVAARDDSIGTAMNALRARVLTAVLTDAALLAAVGPNGAVRYAGMTVGVGRGQAAEGFLVLSFALVVPLDPKRP